MTYVRIRLPKNKNQDVPRSICCGGFRVVPGGPGVEIKNNGVIGKIKKIGGDHIETSKKPFEVEAPNGGIIDLDAMKMKTQEEAGEEEKPEDSKQ